MSQEFEFITAIHEGKIQKNIAGLISECLKHFEGKRIVIKIKKLASKRSDLQNKYYHSGVIPSQIDCFKERWGEIYTKTQVHEWNKANIFCDEKTDTETGEIFKMPGSSASKNITEFNERMEMIRQFFWNRFEWNIPLPTQQLTIN